jgi:hypothetical protein
MKPSAHNINIFPSCFISIHSTNLHLKCFVFSSLNLLQTFSQKICKVCKDGTLSVKELMICTVCKVIVISCLQTWLYTKGLVSSPLLEPLSILQHL